MFSQEKQTNGLKATPYITASADSAVVIEGSGGKKREVWLPSSMTSQESHNSR